MEMAAKTEKIKAEQVGFNLIQWMTWARRLYPRPSATCYGKDDCQDDADDKQYPGDIGSGSGDTRKSKYCSDETDNKECKSPTKHIDILQEFSMFIYDRASCDCHDRLTALSVPLLNRWDGA